MKTRIAALCFLSILFPSSTLFAGWTSVSTNAPTMLVSGSGSSLFAANSSAVYASGDSGKTWQAMTGPSGSPYTALSYFSSQVWIGTEKRGMAYSKDQGSNWSSSNTGLFTAFSADALQVNAIAAQPGSATKLVAANIQGAYISTDGGGSWSANVTGAPTSGTCPFCIRRSMNSLAGASGGTLLAGTDGGVYRSTDGGANWSASGFSGIKVPLLSSDGSVVYAITEGGNLYKSTDGGANWSALSGVSSASAVLAHPSQSGVVYAGTAVGQVYKSSDGGATWETISDGAFSDKVAAIAVPPDAADALVVATASGVYRYEAAAPSVLAITAAVDASLNSTVTSEEVTISGLQQATSISITGGKYSLNDAAFTDQPGLLANGVRLRVQVQSANAYNTTVTAILTIGTGTARFSATTLKPTAITSLTEVFTTAPAGARIENGVAIVTSTTAVVLQSNPPAGSVIQTGAGTPLQSSTGTLTLTDQTGGSTVTFVRVGTTTTPQVAGGTYRVQSTASGNAISVGGSGLVTTTGSRDELTINRSPTKTSAFVQSGTVTLSYTNTFAANGRLAATTSVYGGETAEVTVAGALSRLRIGSLSGDQNLPGDPLTLSDVTTDTTVPRLSGNLARLSNSSSLVTVVQEALNTQFGASGTASYDSATGIVTYTVNGTQYRFIPIGVPTVQVGSSNSFQSRGNRFGASNPASAASGAFTLASRGIQLTMASTLGYFSDLNQAIKALDPSASTRLRSNGALQLTISGTDYICAPGSAVSGGQAGTPGFLMDGDGYFAFRDSSGGVQSLYPVFADTTVVDQTVKAIDPSGSVADSGHGRAAMRLFGGGFTLKPGYTLIPLPSSHASDMWWQDGASLYLRFPDNTAQAFTL